MVRGGVCPVGSSSRPGIFSWRSGFVGTAAHPVPSLGFSPQKGLIRHREESARRVSVIGAASEAGRHGDLHVEIQGRAGLPHHIDEPLRHVARDFHVG